MNVHKIIRNEYVYSVITKIISILLGMIQSILIARFLGAELKGVTAYISSIASIGSIIITFGMHQAYPFIRRKYGKETIYDDYITVVCCLYLFYLIIGVICSIVLPLKITIRALFILIPLLGYSKIIDYVTLIEYPNKRNSWWLLITIIDVLYVAFLWLLVKRNVYWAISILLFADVIRCIVYSCILRVKIIFHKGLFKMLKELVSFGFFPMIALLMTTLNYRIDVLMLHQYSYISDAMIGVYSLGLTLSDKIVLIPDTLKGVLVSKLAKGVPDEEVAKASRIGFWSSFFLFIVILLFGKWLIKILYGDEYSGAYSIIVITAFGLLSVVYFKFIAQYNIINKKQILNVILLSISIVIDVILNLLFIPIWGINGAALATSIGNAVCGVAFVVYFCRKTGIKVSKMIIPQKNDLELIKGLLHHK